METSPRLTSGTRIGPYSIEECIGSGGMGDVYKARDLKLGRDVAIKVVRQAVVTDGGGSARIQREARLLASLNHPNIAAVYGFEDSASTPAIVMELVHGPTLADRLRRGRIPVPDALKIAQQLADALEYAHERGIVHRDLKPGNVKFGGDTVKVLDFGVAKALETRDLEGNVAAASTLAMTSTAMGVVIGTPAYMSPEQATGRPVDRRTDVWAFGCVLYEMLTGTKPFAGDTTTETLAAVIRGEPDWSALPVETPGGIRVLLRRCLEKDSRLRWQAIGDVRIALHDAVTSPASPENAPRRARAPWVAGMLFGATAVMAIGGYVGWTLKGSPDAQKPIARFAIALPHGRNVATGGLNIALSANGDQLAYVAADGHSRQIYVHTISTGEDRPIPGTTDASNLFFSPDGQWLAFAAGGKLRKVSLIGSAVEELTDLGFAFLGGSWSGNHTIVFSPYSSALKEIPDSGGVPRAVTRFDSGETLQTWPDVLPDGGAVLFSAVADAPRAIAAAVVATGERHDLVRASGADLPRYLSPGRLVYLQDGKLMAMPFDPERLEVSGNAVPVAVLSDVGGYTVSASGSLAYVRRSYVPAGASLVWVTRDGKTEEPVGAPARRFNQPRLSADGRHIAVDVIDSSEAMQVWQYDLATDNFRPFTLEGSVNRHPVWTRDSKRIAFMSNRRGATQIFWQFADGSGGPDQLTDNPSTTTADILTIPYGFSRDGQLLTYITVPPTGAPQQWVLHVGSHRSERIPIEAASDGAPQLSPDGRWLAYVANDAHHQRQIFVCAFPGPGGPWEISTEGGNEPQWSPNGRELFFRSGDAMLVVPINMDAGFAAGRPHVLFHGTYLTTNSGYARPNYDVSPDGQRFLMLKPVAHEEVPITEIHVVLNWSEELKRGGK